MSTLELVYPGDSHETLLVGALKVQFSARLEGQDPAHVRALAEVSQIWEPLLVRRGDGVIVDGVHRFMAAVASGKTEVEVEYFDGDDAEAFIECVRRNATHGMPLTLADKRSAARRIVGLRPEWSDRRIAELCGLSPKTVSSLRRKVEPDPSAFDHRIGRDGRTQKLRRVGRSMPSSRQRPGSLLDEELPRVSYGKSPQPGPSASTDSPAPLTPNYFDLELPQEGISADLACQSSRNGEVFCAWFDSTRVAEIEIEMFVGTIPVSRAYEIADEARRRARLWTSFADTLEGRTRAHRRAERPSSGLFPRLHQGLGVENPHAEGQADDKRSMPVPTDM